jgi:hypothetical protein
VTQRQALFLAFGFSTVLGCQSGVETPPEPPTPGTPVHFGATAPHDLALITKVALNGFRANGAAFQAGFTTHDAVVRDGAITLTPYNYADGSRQTGGPLELRTSAIYRTDGTILDSQLQQSRVVRGVLELERGTALETIENREDGIEQSWRFDNEPTGSGDLHIEIAANQVYTSTTDRGLHFTSPQGLGFRYGHALWIDALGNESLVTANWDGQHIVLSIPEETLGNSVYPAVLDPTITAEVAADTQVAGSSTGANARQASIAFDGTNYLVVWADQRLSGDDDIFATRVSQAGAVLDANGIQIAATPGVQSNPVVAFTGSTYVVAWEDFLVTGGTTANIVAATVSTGGTVASLGTVAGTANNETTPAIAGGGGTALLAWNDALDIRAARFSGGAFGAAFAVSAQAGIDEIQPAVALNPGGNYLVAWSEGATATADLKGQFVTQAGALSGGAIVISAGAGRQSSPSATFDGTNYALAWTNNNNGNDIFGARVDTAGTTLDTHPEGTGTAGGVTISGATGTQQNASIACASGGCFVIWEDRRAQAGPTGIDVFGQLLTATFGLSGGEVTVSNVIRSQLTPALVSNGSSFFGTYVDQRINLGNTVMGTRISGAGAVTDPNGILLPLGNNRESAPDVGVFGTTTGIVWGDSRSFGPDIEMVRFGGTQGNTKLDATAKTISNATFSQTTPTITADSAGGNFFVVWSDTRNGVDHDIFGSRVDANGTALDPGGIPISTATRDQLRPDVATNGTVTVVVWDDRRNNNFDIFAALVNSSGTVTMTDIPIIVTTGDQTNPTVAFDSTNNQFVIVWTDSRVVGNADIFGTRLDVTGTVLDPGGVSISNAANGQFKPQISFAGGKYLVAFESRATDSGGDIVGAIVTGGSSLTAGATFPISSTAGQQFNAAIGPVGGTNGGWLVAWTDSRNSATSGLDIFGASVASGGIATADFAISTDPEDEDAASFGSFNPVKADRIAYERVRADLGTVRVVTRQITSDTLNGQACSTNSQCSTGFCVDGKCCDTACGGGTNDDCQSCRGSRTGQPDGVCAPQVAGIICRNYANTFCDLREVCDGTAITCPPDIGRNQGLVCNTLTGSICPRNDTAGAPHICP